MKDTYRIGVLGMTHDHLWDNLAELMATGRADLVAAADEHEPLRDKIEDAYGCKTYEHGEQLLEDEELDAVYVFADNALSELLSEEAAKRGLHVLVEKPMAASLEGAEWMVRSARETNIRLMVNWPFAWWPQLQYAMRLAGEGVIGDVWEVRYRAAHSGPREEGCSAYFVDWLVDDHRNGAGALVDYCCYGAALARCLLGMPTRVTGITGRLCKEEMLVEDNGVILCEYPRAFAVAEGSWTQVGKPTAYQPTIYGTTGTLHMEPRAGGRLWHADSTSPEGKEVTVPEPDEHLRSASAHFLNGLDTGEAFLPLCTDRVCRDVQEILEAGLLSAREHHSVSLPLPRGE